MKFFYTCLIAGETTARSQIRQSCINIAVENLAILYRIQYGLTPPQLLPAFPGGIQYSLSVHGEGLRVRFFILH
ncbi:MULTISPECIES: hypothetical protein [unclassified Coleofasciculus]|uniref:hypothetical protein n=1 Tax=unclassified Coleofasciculus TaxID=2692782 RepID=UPI001688286E|nr:MULTISPECIES: hypothetical protein [unclassified Coleofasciculus]MBD2085017.1 hypothetical protein [Coleofasciculus sp. FACHB-542]